MDHTLDFELWTDAVTTFLPDGDVEPDYADKLGYVLLESPTPLHVLGGGEDYFEELPDDLDEGCYMYIGRELAVVAPSGIFLLRAIEGRVVTKLVLAPQEVA